MGEGELASRPPAVEPDAPAGADVSGRHRRFGLRTALISGLTLLSRVLGYVREMISAWLFGDHSGIFDAFITAWRVPNLFRRLLGEGAIATSLQTSLTRVDARSGNAAGRELFVATWRILAALLVVLSGAVMLLVWHVPDFMPGTGFAWLGADPQAVRELVVRVMPFVVLVCLTAAAGGALQVRGHFATPALAPVVLNVVWIAALVAIALTYGAISAETTKARQMEMVRWLAWAVLAAGLAQLLIQLPALARFGLLRAPWPRPGPEARREALAVLWRSAPLAFGAAVYQINVMVDGLMAEGLLPDGAPTLHYYANRVQQFPMALVSIAATSAVFPALAALGQEGRKSELRGLHDRTQRAIFFVALPASVGLFVLAQPIISLSFEHGAFGPEGVARTSAALRWLALAILPAGAVGLVARAYYALGDFRTPVRVSSVLLVANVLLNLVFLLGLGMDIDGLALATSLTSAAHLAWLLPGLRRRLELPAAAPGFGRATLRMSLAALACGLAAALSWKLLPGLLGRPLALVAAILAGAGAYFVLAQLLGVPEWHSFRARMRQLLDRKRGS